jgi:hypothetical protein
VDEELRQQIVDDENIRLLRICYFIAACFTAVFSIFILFYTFFFTFMFTQFAGHPGESGPPAFVGRLIGVFGGLLFLFMIGIAVMQFLTGQRLGERRSRIFCMVIAGITCISFPYGTLLGVWTFLVMARPTVKRTFEERLSMSS